MGMRGEAIGVGDDPLAFGIAPCRGVHCRNRNVHAMRSEAGLACESTEIKTVAASDVQNHVTLRCSQHAGDAAQQRPRYAAIVQSPPRSHRFRSIARLLRSPILWLEQGDVA